MQLESANKKVIDEYEQNNDTESAGQFQMTLDEEANLIDNVLTRTSKVKNTKRGIRTKTYRAGST